MTTSPTPPERFRAEHAHYVEDLAFWRSLADEVGGPILDLGAAVGRVAIPLARDGHAVWAVDASAGMLGELGEALNREPPHVARRIRRVRADFRTLELERAFPLAIMPMNTLQALLTRDDQLASLRAVRRHVEPGGVFAFDVVMPDLDAIAGAVGHLQPGETWSDPDTGAVLAHSAWFDSVDPESGTVAFTARIVETPANGTASAVTHLRAHTVHLYPPSELWGLLVDAGFAVESVLGDFAGGPLQADAEHQIYRCRVPG